MLIQCPLDEQLAPHVKELIGIGADEFYLGYRNRLKFSEQILSRRSGIFPNFISTASTADAIRCVKENSKKVFVAINETFYPPAYIKQILVDIAKLRENGVDGFIIADVNLFLQIQESFPDLHLVASTVAHIFNSKALDFFKNLGAKRCIMPRQLTISEIKEIINNNQDMEFEIFIKNDECFNIDGICAYSHFDTHADPPACRHIERMCGISETDRASCGVCSLYDLKDLPNLILKIVGRGKSFEWIKNDVNFVKRVLLFMDQANTKEEFIGFCKKEYLAIYRNPCRERCYYTYGHK